MKDPIRELSPVSATSLTTSLLDLLEQRERTRNEFRLAETAHHETRADGYWQEQGVYESAHAEVQDWLNDSDHLAALLDYLRAHRTGNMVMPETGVTGRARADELDTSAAGIRALLRRLLKWEANMGGFEAPVWADVRTLARTFETLGNGVSLAVAEIPGGPPGGEVNSLWNDTELQP